MINLEHVSKEYPIGDIVFRALDDVSLKIKAGEFAAIIGPSGSGKSTLMHVIGLLDKPSKGKVFIENREISRLNDAELSSLRNEFVGFVFQQFNLIPKLTNLENVLLPTVYTKKMLTYDARKKGMDILTRFGIGDKADSYPNKISGGQQQRVAIARALIMEPKLLLADEPTGNLDQKSGHEILDLLVRLHKEEGLTLVIVTHDPEIASRSRKHIHIKDGKITTTETK